jgi:hypothetical protein
MIMPSTLLTEPIGWGVLVLRISLAEHSGELCNRIAAFARTQQIVTTHRNCSDSSISDLAGESSSAVAVTDRNGKITSHSAPDRKAYGLHEHAASSPSSMVTIKAKIGPTGRDPDGFHGAYNENT